MADPEAQAGLDVMAEAISWFGDTLAAGESINETWISRIGTSEMRVVDVSSGSGRHRLLCRVKSIDDATWRWDELDYEGVQAHLDEIKTIAADRDIALWAFAGPMTSLPTRLAPPDHSPIVDGG